MSKLLWISISTFLIAMCIGGIHTVWVLSNNDMIATVIVGALVVATAIIYFALLRVIVDDMKD